MTGSLKWRGILVLICIVFALVALAPTFFSDSLPPFWTNNFHPIQKGLDLQGGMHLVLGVRVDEAVDSHVDALIDQIEQVLRDEDIVFKRVERQPGFALAITVYDEEAAGQVDKLMSERFRNLEATTVTTEGAYIQKIYRLSDGEADEIRDYAVRQALETLRNRIDQFNVREPVFQRQAGNRILVQLPGIDDPERAIKLLDQTARLEFKMVVDNADVQKALNGDLPRNAELLYERNVNNVTGAVSETPIVVESRPALTGDSVTDAQVNFSNQTREAFVLIHFDPLGGERFEKLTAANVGRRMAIVLDGKVYSAPVIRERISGGAATISGNFTVQEARDLVIVLRAGALPASVDILENRTVGPSLGQDSIDQGVRSILIGALLVIVAMILYYRLSGVVANVALLLNLLFILAMLSLFGATLTLPGIAGIVLTIGMAVDANVLIFERIREELRSGRPANLAVESGFGKAFLTIVDANITTLIAAVVLLQFGTGPVKGFAVTLSIGILSSVFTAVFVSRLIFDFVLSRRQVKKLSI